jgi:hypothetical protein
MEAKEGIEIQQLLKNKHSFRTYEIKYDCTISSGLTQKSAPDKDATRNRRAKIKKTIKKKINIGQSIAYLYVSNVED